MLLFGRRGDRLIDLRLKCLRVLLIELAQLLRFIELLEQHLGRTVEKRLLPMQPGDVPDTWADVSALRRDVGYAPTTSIEQGVENFVAWYREYHAKD